MDKPKNHDNNSFASLGIVTPDQLSALEAKCRQMRSEVILAALLSRPVILGRVFDKIAKAVWGLPRSDARKAGKSKKIPAHNQLLAD